MRQNFTTPKIIIICKAVYSALLILLFPVIAQGQCPPVSTLSCEQVQVGLPYSLSFASGVSGTLGDKSGVGTGFTMADAYSGTRLSADGAATNPQVPGYEPAKLSLTGGVLQVVTNKGIASTTSNNQINSLGVQVDSRNRLQVEVTLVNPYYGTAYQQAGLWLGLSDKTFVKLVVVGNRVELRREVNDVSGTADQRITGILSGLSNQAVRLRLVMDPSTNQAQGFYSVNGGSYTSVGTALSITGMGLTSSTAYVGIQATHRNATTPVTYTFDDFKVEGATTPPPAENRPPVVVTAPLNQSLSTGQQFSFSGGEYSDPDEGDALTYTATLATGGALPTWLQFNATTAAFTGTAPTAATSLSVRVTATDKAGASVSATFTVEVKSGTTAGCPPVSTLACEQVQVGLPYSLTFASGVSGTLGDKSGVGTGFTMADAYSGTRLAADGSATNPQVPGYEPAKISLTGGTLQLVTNKGIAYLTNNNQLNSLGVKVDSRNRLQVEVTLVNPFYGTSGQQGGLWLGLSDKTFVKLVVVGNKVEFRKEVNDVSGTADQRITGSISGLNNQRVRLRMLLDPGANTIEGFYSVNGGAYTSVGTALSISGMGLTSSTAYAGIQATHRNATSAVTYTFDDFIVEEATSTESLRPYVTAVRPADGATNVPLDQSVSVDLEFPSGKSIDGSTVNTNTVKLYKVANGVKTEVSGTAVNSTAAGDAITLSATLTASTTYEFVISDQVKDLNGYAIIPFTSRFTTISSNPDTPTDLEGVSFTQRTVIDNSFGAYGFTTLAIGPDRRLYAAGSGGQIERWDINADGTLSNHVTITLFGSTVRLLIGLRFDPSATSSNLIAWISHSSGAFSAAPDWSSKISRVNLNNPSNPQIQDYVINLPRSYKDHSVNSIDFGPDGALYVNMGSNTAMGAPDAAWGNRPERLLTAAVLRLDITKAQQAGLPVDVKTEDGGNYNPYAADAPLTIYASGLRNAYDLVWHSNGQLYVPTNGSAAGGNTPALKSGTIWSNGQQYTGPDVPSMTDVRDTQNDYLFRVQKGGYYGHPNVLRNEYILNGGNPTSSVDPGEIVWTINGKTYGYPVGTPKEPNYRGWSYDFGTNISPNGVIEYKSNAFDGKLKGRLLVCRFSGGDDIIILEPGASSKDIVSAVPGIEVPGLRKPFANPLDIVEDVVTGNLYITEYYDGNGKGKPFITLLKADKPANGEPPVVSSTTLINSGGGVYTDGQGRSWSADAYVSGGSTATKSFDVAGTTDDGLYLSYRYATSSSSTTPGAPFSYSIPVPASGTYTVMLHFVEPYFKASNARVFHVDAEGQRVLSNYDIYAQNGYGRAVVQTFTNVSVTDGTLNLSFSSVKNNAIISAIEVLQNTTAAVAKAGNNNALQGIESNDQELLVYPNPATGGKINIELNGFEKNSPIEVTLRDVTGRIMQTKSLETDGAGVSKTEMLLDKSMSPGIYIIHTQGTTGIKYKKIIVK